MTIRKIASSAAGGDASTHIGNNTELFYDPLGSTINVSDGVTPGGRPMGSGSLVTTIPLTSEILLGCNAAPYQLLPPPGAGKMYLIYYVSYFSKFNTTAYSGDGIQLWYGSSISADEGSMGVFNSGDNEIQLSFSYSVANSQPFPVDICTNAALNLWSPNSALVGGDGTGSVTIQYSILTL